MSKLIDDDAVLKPIMEWYLSRKLKPPHGMSFNLVHGVPEDFGPKRSIDEYLDLLAVDLLKRLAVANPVEIEYHPDQKTIVQLYNTFPYTPYKSKGLLPTLMKAFDEKERHATHQTRMEDKRKAQ